MPQQSAGIFIESLTWPEMERALASINTVVLPLGSRCKEHGPHLPLNADWIMAEYLARRVAEKCRVLVAPTVQYGYYPAFIEYPGSVSIAETTFRDFVADICRSFSRNGARRIYVLNTGISTLAPLTAARQLLADEGIRMEFSDLRNFAVSERRAVEQQPHGTHADEIETSMMLYIAPQVVHLERARPELASPQLGPLTRNARGAGLYSPSGAWGDPTLATAEKGRLIVEALVSEMIPIIGEL
ncbi:MAG TPA: creatininase family protein [Tepidisphaeraceae bacterium]|jgi:creatinine amidohydrolase|nr:creatininase family protein [Tepidisphaeraceae bacterium]